MPRNWLRIEVVLGDRKYVVREFISDAHLTVMPEESLRWHLDSMIRDLEHEIAIDRTNVEKE